MKRNVAKLALLLLFVPFVDASSSTAIEDRPDTPTSPTAIVTVIGQQRDTRTIVFSTSCGSGEISASSSIQDATSAFVQKDASCFELSIAQANTADTMITVTQLSDNTKITYETTNTITETKDKLTMQNTLQISATTPDKPTFGKADAVVLGLSYSYISEDISNTERREDTDLARLQILRC